MIILSVLPLFISAANALTLSTVSGHPGDVLTVTASLANSDAVTAVQADIPLSAHVQYVSNSVQLVSARSNSHSIVANAADNVLHVTIFSLAGNALNGDEGELFTFQVTLGNEPATYTLTPAVTLAGTSGQQLTANADAGSVTLLSPKIEVVTTSIDYGHIPIRATYTKTLSVRNTGNEPLHISNVLLSASEFSVASTEYTIDAGQTQNITLTFAPLVHGAISETVRLRSDAINDADVYGANLARIVADPFSVNELRVQPASGTSDEVVTVTLRMNNMESIVGAQVSFKMPAALEYVAGSVAPLERAASHVAVSTLSNDTLTLMLYSPSNTAVTDEDGDLLTFDVRLNGKSGSYALKPINTLLVNAAHQNMVSAVYNANVTIQSPTISSNASLSLGHIPVTKKCTVNYSVRNTGQAPLTIEGAAFLQEGFRLLTPMPLVIAKNTTTNLEIEFAPSIEGNVSTTMQLYSNDPATRMKSVAVSGSVYEPNTMTLSGTTIRSTYSISIGLDNYSDIAGLQFDLSWPLEQEPTWEVERATRASGHQVSWSKIDEGLYRFIVFALSNTPLAEHSGEVLSLTLDAETSALLDGQTVSMSNALVVHPTKGNKEVTLPAPLIVSYEPQIFYTVYFKDWDGSVLSVQEVMEGDAATPPDEPIREGYLFIGWDKEFSHVTRDLTVTALYEEIVVPTYTFNYNDKEGYTIDSEEIELHFPEAPIIAGFTFRYWNVVEGNIADGINIQAVYTANVPTSAPEVYTNPANPAQKLVQKGNVYILTGDKTYTVTGQAVK